MRRIYAVLLVTAFGLSARTSLSQVATGTPPLGSFGGGPFDTVNLGNLNVHFAVPVLNKAGRGTPFSYSLGYDSSVWYPVTSSGVTSWVYLSDWGWTVESPAIGGSINTTAFTFHCTGNGPPTGDPPPPSGGGGYNVNGFFISTFIDPLGTAHRVHTPEDPCGT